MSAGFAGTRRAAAAGRVNMQGTQGIGGVFSPGAEKKLEGRESPVDSGTRGVTARSGGRFAACGQADRLALCTGMLLILIRRNRITPSGQKEGHD